MREIKFRCWDSVNGVMRKVRNLSYNSSNDICYDSGVDIGMLKEGSHKLMQYTGLKDKNGVEIYEGDIIQMCYIHDEGGGWKRNTKERGKVYFDSTWGVKFDCIDMTQRTANTHWKRKKSTFLDACDVEVIGNIYENPELLETII